MGLRRVVAVLQCTVIVFNGRNSIVILYETCYTYTRCTSSYICMYKYIIVIIFTFLRGPMATGRVLITIQTETRRVTACKYRWRSCAAAPYASPGDDNIYFIPPR